MQAMNMDTISSAVAKQFTPIKAEIEDEKETKQLKSKADKEDSKQKAKSSRSTNIERKHNRIHPKSKGGKKENNYEKKLDYRCEGEN